MKCTTSLLFSLLILTVSNVASSSDLDPQPAYMLTHVLIMSENNKMLDAIKYPIATDVNKLDLMYLKTQYQLYPFEKEKEIEYRDNVTKCQKVTHHYYDIRAHKKGWLTKLEDTFTGMNQSNSIARRFGEKAGELYILCIDELPGSCGSKRLQEFKFKGCKAISLRFESDYLFRKYEYVNDSNQLKELPSKKRMIEGPSKGSRVISR